MLFVKKRFLWVMVILLVTGSDLFFWSTGNMPYRSITLPLLIPLFFGFFWSTLIVNCSLSLALFFVSYALIYFSQLFTKFDQMAILVYLFALVEIFFGTVCFVYFFQKIGWERFMILAAPILFFISSILTGYNTFLYNSHFFTYGIGIAYCLGQFLVVHFFSRKYALP